MESNTTQCAYMGRGFETEMQQIEIYTIFRGKTLDALAMMNRLNSIPHYTLPLEIAAQSKYPGNNHLSFFFASSLRPAGAVTAPANFICPSRCCA